MPKKKTPQRADYYTPQYAITGERSPLRQMNEFAEDVERSRRQVMAARPGSDGLHAPPVPPGGAINPKFDTQEPTWTGISSTSRKKPQLTTLENGDTGFFDPTHTMIKANDASGKVRQLFNVVDQNTGDIVERKFLDPKGSFVSMTAPENITNFVQDPDTFNPTNPSGFDPKTFQVLQQFKNDPQGLVDYTAEHPEFKIFKQETTRR